MLKVDQKQDTEDLVKITTKNSDQIDDIDFSKDLF